MDGNNSYYNNLYNMFGGYNPIVDKRIAALRRFGFLAGGAVIGSLALTYIFILVLNATGLIGFYLNDPFISQVVNALGQFVFILVPFVAMYFVLKPTEKLAVADTFKPVESAPQFILAIFAGLMICSVGDYATSFLSGIFNIFGVYFFTGMEDQVLPPGFAGVTITIINSAVLPALLEEFAFRGVLLQPMRKFGDKYAIVATSFVFALMHGNMVQIPFAFISGLALGYFCISTGSIWTSVVIHFFNNFIAVIWSYLTADDTQLSYFFYLVTTIALVVLGIIALIIYRINYRAKLIKINDSIEPQLKRAAFVCAPTLVLTLAWAIGSTLNNTTVSTAIGMLLLILTIAAVAFIIIRMLRLLKGDTRIRYSRAYSASMIIIVVSTFLSVATVVALTLAAGQTIQ